MTAPYVAGKYNTTAGFNNGQNGSSIGYPVMLPVEWTTTGGMTTYTSNTMHGTEAEVAVGGVYDVRANIQLLRAARIDSSGNIEQPYWTNLKYVDVISSVSGGNDWGVMEDSEWTGDYTCSLNFFARVWSVSNNNQSKVVAMGGWKGGPGLINQSVHISTHLNLNSQDRVKICGQAFGAAFQITKGGLSTEVQGTTASIVKVA